MSGKPSYESKLELRGLYFDELTFNRVGPNNANSAEFNFSRSVQMDTEVGHIVRLLFKCDKPAEYKISMRLTGIFYVEQPEDFPISVEEALNTNAIAIMFPYIRSQLSLLTAQPGITPLVMPPMNIIAMFNEASNNDSNGVESEE